MTEPDTVRVKRRPYQPEQGTLRLIRWQEEIRVDTEQLARWARALKVARRVSYTLIVAFVVVELVLIAGGVW